MAMDMNVALRITAGVSGQQAVEQLRVSMERLQNTAGGIAGGFKMATGALGALGAAFSAAEIVGFVKRTIDAADAMQDMANRTGVGVRALSELDLAAKLNGTSLEEVEKGLTKISTKAVEAATSGGTAKVAFDALGVAVKNADGSMRPALDIMDDVGKALRDIQDPTLKSALAVELFGKSGARLIPLLENMADAREEARQLGAVVGDDFATASAAFNDNVDRMSATLGGLSRQILNEVLPGMNRLLEAMLNAKKQGGGMFDAGIQQLGINLTTDFSKPAEALAQLTEEVRKMKLMSDQLGQDNFMNRLLNTSEAKKALDAKIAVYQRNIDQLRTIRDRAVEDRGFKPEVKDSRAADILKNLDPNAAKERERAEKAIADFMRQQADALLRLKGGEDALLAVQAERLGIKGQEFDELKRIWEETKREKKRQDDQKDEERQYAEQDRMNRQAVLDLQREINAALEDAKSPAEKLSETLEKYKLWLEMGKISPEQFTALVDRATEKVEELGDKSKDVFTEIRDAVEGFGKDAADAMAEFVMSGKMSFSDLISSMIKDLLRLIIYRSITGPLFDWFGSFLPGGGGSSPTGGNGLKFGGGKAMGGPISGGNAYLVGENGPELFFPRQGGSIVPNHAMGGTSVVVNNYSGAQASARETTDSRGNRRVEVTIGEMVAGELQRTGSAPYNAMRSSFGARPMLAGR